MEGVYKDNKFFQSFLKTMVRRLILYIKKIFLLGKPMILQKSCFSRTHVMYGKLIKGGTRHLE